MKWKIALLLIATLAIAILPFYRDSNLHITICNVGQGDGIIIQTPDKKIYLVDGGPDDKILGCLGEKTPFYERSIEAVFVSHLHADHMVGFIEIMNRYNSKNIIVNKVKQNTPEVTQLYTKIADKKVTIKSLYENNTIHFGTGVIGKVYYPKPDSWNMESGEWQAYLDDFNDSSLVFALIQDANMFLFTGDAGSAILDQVTKSPEFQKDVEGTTMHILKIPHHGSSDGISERLLDVFKPNLAVISVGKENKFGHPHKDTIDSLKKRNIKLFRTDLNGNVEIIMDSQKLRVNVDKNEP